MSMFRFNVLPKQQKQIILNDSNEEFFIRIYLSIIVTKYDEFTCNL